MYRDGSFFIHASHKRTILLFFFLSTMECQSVIADGKYWCLDTMNIHARAIVNYIQGLLYPIQPSSAGAKLRSPTLGCPGYKEDGRAGACRKDLFSAPPPRGSGRSILMFILSQTSYHRQRAHIDCSCRRMQRECVSKRRNSFEE